MVQQDMDSGGGNSIARGQWSSCLPPPSQGGERGEKEKKEKRKSEKDKEGG